MFNGDGTVSFDGVTRSLAEISEIRVTGSGGDDTFTVDFNGTDPGITIGFDGGAGFDTLVTRGSDGLASTAIDGSSGTLQFGSSRVEYAGIEPIDDNSAGDKTLTLTTGDNQAELLVNPVDPGKLLLRAIGGDSFEQVSFFAPVLGGQILNILGGDGNDTLTIRGILNLGLAAFLVNFEKILVDGAAITAGSVTLTAEEQTTAGLSAADCTDFDDFSVLACLDHDATTEVIVDGGSITAGDIALTAHSTVDPDESAATAYAVIVNSNATVDVRGAAQLNATGAVTVTATSTVGPFTLNKDYGDAAFIFSNATATISEDAVVDAGGAVTVTATSIVDAGAAPGTDAAKSESDGSGSFDAAVAILTVFTEVLGKVTGNARVAVGGALGISAVNKATLNGVGDATDATSGAGIAVAYLEQITDAAIDSTNATGSTAASLTLTAEQESTITATAKASQGGANQNNKDANDGDRGQGQSKGDGGGSIGIAGALGIAILDTDTKARVVGAKVHTTGAQNITAKAKNTLTASGDGGSKSSSGLGLGIGIGILIVDLLTEAFVQNADLDAAAGGITVAATGPATGDSSFTATAISGAKGGADVSIAGSLALAKIDSVTASELRGNGQFGGSNVTLTARGSHKSSATATSKQDGGGSVGAGASVALTLIDAEITAAVADGATPTGVAALALGATGLDDATTETNGGAAGGTGVSLTGVASIAIQDVRTRARVNSGSPLALGGGITATAAQTAKATTKAKGATLAGSGASLAADDLVRDHERGPPRRCLDRPRCDGCRCGGD